MITGKVTANLEATIEVEVSGAQPPWRRAEAVIDSGFNGYLTLPSHLITLLKLPYAGNRYAILGDGSDVTLDAYFATVSWHGQYREVVALQGEGAPLVGM
ncbi:MAG: clan AA aspartic protease [Blastocatellales bacterium]